MLGSFAKGLSVIEAFSSDRPKLTISDASTITGLDRSAARRCLLTLVELGYADFDGKNFSLTPRILRLGTSCLATMPLPRIVQPLLDRLSTEIGQSTSVSILDHDEIVYVARAAQQRLMSINLMAGSRLPASCTSMGRVLLAGLTDAEVRNILKNNPPKRHTAKSVTSSRKIVELVQHARIEGFAIVDQEIEIGLRSIAVPLHDARGRTVAALNVGVAAVQDSADELKHLYLDKLLAVQSTLRPLL
jgi:IclR family pca regulon transcriptional regulator